MPKRKLQAYEDPSDPGNDASHHTGKPCVEKGCDRPAGTAWSPLWCHPCNVERMKRISSTLNGLAGRGRKKSPAAELVDFLKSIGATARIAHPVEAPYGRPPEDEEAAPPKADAAPR